MEERVKASFSSRLKELRAEKKVHQAQLAEDLKIGRASVSNYEIGSRLPDADVLAALADYFDVSVDYLIGRTNLRAETINGADTVISDLAYLSTILPRDRKDDLYRILYSISKLLETDKRRENDCSVLSAYASIIEDIKSFDEVVDKRITFFQDELEDAKNGSIDENTTTKNLIKYYVLNDVLRDLALAIGEKVARTLRTDALLCVTRKKELLSNWPNEAHKDGDTPCPVKPISRPTAAATTE